MPKTVLFIDGANLYSTCQMLRIELDFAKFNEFFGHPDRMLYFTAIKNTNEVQPIRKLYDFIEYNGFNMIKKPTKEFMDHRGMVKIKGNMDIEIAVSMMKMADRVDHMYLFTGDGDFKAVVEAVQEKGVRVTVVSSLYSDPSEGIAPMIADELRRQADNFMDLREMKGLYRSYSSSSNSIVKKVFK